MIYNCLNNLKSTNPIIHNITNYVTVNDCANMILASGASPIMSDEYDEIEDIVSISNGLNINIGTLNKETIKSMILAGITANKLDKPVLLDPVGTGASKLRTNTSYSLLKEIKFSVIKGNISEIKTLMIGSSTTLGVDATIEDKITNENLQETIKLLKDFSKKINSIIVVTGEIDLVVDENKAYVIRNGHKMMSKITGSGCMLGALITAFISANKSNMLDATACAVICSGICGEIAHNRLNDNEGNITFRNYFIDAMFNMDTTTLEKGAKYEIY